MEKKYVITEKQLMNLLADYMELEALENSGVDGWCWYGENFAEMRQLYLYGDRELTKEEREEIEDYTFQDVARVIIERGEFEEYVDEQGNED